MIDRMTARCDNSKTSDSAHPRPSRVHKTVIPPKVEALHHPCNLLRPLIKMLFLLVPSGCII